MVYAFNDDKSKNDISTIVELSLEELNGYYREYSDPAMGEFFYAKIPSSLKIGDKTTDPLSTSCTLTLNFFYLNNNNPVYFIEDPIEPILVNLLESEEGWIPYDPRDLEMTDYYKRLFTYQGSVPLVENEDPYDITINVDVVKSYYYAFEVDITYSRNGVALFPDIENRIRCHESSISYSCINKQTLKRKDIKPVRRFYVKSKSPGTIPAQEARTILFEFDDSHHDKRLFDSFKKSFNGVVMFLSVYEEGILHRDVFDTSDNLWFVLYNSRQTSYSFDNDNPILGELLVIDMDYSI